MDIVRVLRLIEYEGPRDWVEKTLCQSLHGTKVISGNKTIRATTLGDFPSLMLNNDCSTWLDSEGSKREMREG